MLDRKYSRVLYIDLTNKRFYKEDRHDLFEKYIGGAGVAIQLLKENCPQGIDAFDPQNPIIFAVGPLNGLFPLASKTVAMFKSPHTGNLGESHAGGRSAVAIRMAGYGAIVIKGKSERPCYIAIHDGKVFFRDATTLWGNKSSISAGHFIRENEPSTGFRTIIRIGHAGERLIPFACVATETYRHFGRLGLGAVFGSKNLKAVVVSGKRSLPVFDTNQYNKVYDEIFKSATESALMKKYHEIGTPVNVASLNISNGLPTRNLKQSSFEKADKISGEAIAEGFLGKRLACAHCPVACIHIAAIREPYSDEPYFYKTTMIGYDYELIYALGSMLGGSDVPGMLMLIDKIEYAGLDCMTTGVVFAWMTEAFERGIITEKETMGVIPKWGDYKSYQEALRLLLEQPNDFYLALSKGVRHVASIYGGKDFALSFGGNEMPGYHTGPSAHVGYLIGARHSHLDNAGYSVDKKLLSSSEITAQEIASLIVSEEKWRQILSSLVICFFAREIYKPEVVLRALQTTGFNLSQEELTSISKEILKEKYAFKIREGFSFDNLEIPERIFQTPSSAGFINKDFFMQTLNSAKEIIQKDIMS
ncbi:MAG: aldehyde ferredoxin oxidoreductase family protein [Thermodesulfovibrionales bacterium]|nr:aldehyde ferredoxin oxidoreductase family protein [Thermodesulfovibrionales bacterium]